MILELHFDDVGAECESSQLSGKNHRDQFRTDLSLDGGGEIVESQIERVLVARFIVQIK